MGLRPSFQHSLSVELKALAEDGIGFNAQPGYAPGRAPGQQQSQTQTPASLAGNGGGVERAPVSRLSTPRLSFGRMSLGDEEIRLPDSWDLSTVPGVAAARKRSSVLSMEALTMVFGSGLYAEGELAPRKRSSAAIFPEIRDLPSEQLLAALSDVTAGEAGAPSVVPRADSSPYPNKLTVAGPPASVGSRLAVETSAAAASNNQMVGRSLSAPARSAFPLVPAAAAPPNGGRPAFGFSVPGPELARSSSGLAPITAMHSVAASTGGQLPRPALFEHPAPFELSEVYGPPPTAASSDPLVTSSAALLSEVSELAVSSPIKSEPASPHSPTLHRRSKRSPKIDLTGLPRHAAAYKDEDGQWAFSLTELPTVELNAFLKRSTFTAVEITDLKRVRRQRKNKVYTKRSRVRKAAREGKVAADGPLELGSGAKAPIAWPEIRRDQPAAGILQGISSG